MGTSSILDWVKQFFQSMVLPGFRETWKEFNDKRRGIPVRDLMHDVFFIARSLWLFLFFDVLIFLFFVVLPQGKDIVLSILVKKDASLLNTLLFLVPGLIFWSIISEFGTRYKLYVADNSGDSLSAERVEWRKFLQFLFTRFSLYYPVVIMFFSFVVIALKKYGLEWQMENWPILGTLFLFYLVFVLLYRLYSKKEETAQKRPTWFSLSPNELLWTSKLYGIYNDFVYMFPFEDALKRIKWPESPFKVPPSTDVDVKVCVVRKDCDNVSYLLKMPDENEPDKKCEASVKQSELLAFPQQFEPINAQHGPEVMKPLNLVRFFKLWDDIWGRWTYRVPCSLFPQLHKQLRWLIGISVGLIFLFCLIGNPVYQRIGAPAIVVFSFACWTGIYLGFIFLDHAPLKIRYRWSRIVLVWVIGCMIWGGHPVRLTSELRYKPRPGMKDHFRQWVDHYKAAGKDSIPMDQWKRWGLSAAYGGYPVVFVCAEGGASRTGAFTSMLLSKMQDAYPGFNRKVCAYSSVSGGSLGIGVYNALANFRPGTPTDTHNPGNFSALSKAFFLKDHLSCALGRLFFGEVVQLFLPFHLDALDRAAGLEISWEEGYQETAMRKGDVNVFDADYFLLYGPDNLLPAWFINTSYVEEGLQSWLVNVKPDSSMQYGEKRDVWDRFPGSTRYSTAINFSSRFPLISPTATIHRGDYEFLDFQDGGETENRGAQTMYEYLKALNGKDSVFMKKNIVPIVVMLEYGEKDTSSRLGKSITGQWTSIPQLFYNVRCAKATYATDDLKALVSELHGSVIELALAADSKEVPLNWILSQDAVDSIDHYCDTVISSNPHLNVLKNVLTATK